MSEAERLDKRLAREFDQYSRSTLQKFIISGKVTVNGAAELDPNKRVRPEDQVNLDYTDSQELKSVGEDPDVIYEDDDCVVISKPLGMLTHSKGNFNDEQTVATWLQEYLGASSDGNRDGIVHRLDRATSGVMICAKNDESLKWLQKQFSTRKVKKTYMAVVSGEIEPEEAVIDMPIGRNPKQPQRFRVDSNGKSASTYYKTEDHIETKRGFVSLLTVQPTTGRTHQLRVHLAHLKHPIIGDDFYDGLPADRLYLHAQALELTLPSKKRMTFSAKMPSEFLNPGVK